MSTLNQIAYNILNSLEGGRSTNNSFISLDQIKYNINYYRALILHRDLNNSVFQDDHFYQNFDLNVSYSQKNLYCSDKKMPKLLRLSHKFPIRVKFDNYEYPFVEKNRISFDQYNSYTSGGDKSYLDEDRLYIVSNSYINKVKVSGIFENPSEAYIWAGKDPEQVDDLYYPLSEDIIQRLSESIISHKVQLLEIPPDIKKDNVPITATGN